MQQPLLLLMLSGIATSNGAAPTIESDSTSVVITADDLSVVTPDKTWSFVAMATSAADLAKATQDTLDGMPGMDDFTKVVDDKVETVNVEIGAIADDLTKLSSNTAEFEGMFEAMSAKQEKDAATIADLLKANKLLTDGLTALQKEFKELAEATPSFTPAQCDALVEPDNGAVEYVGEHGDKVPVSVTVTFTCSDGFFPIKNDTEATCQHDGDAAKWSAPGKHPGCMACSVDCAMCADASVCDRCAANALLVDGKCVDTPGLTKETAASSCLEILKANPDAKSIGAGYWIKVPRMESRKMFCFMADWDSEYGGGWTMVGRGVGGNPDCWLQAGEEGCNAWSMWDTRKSFMYKDNTINGIPHTAIWYQGYGTIKASFYYESNSETGEGCQYGHATAASNACNCPHDTPDFEGDCPQGMLYEGHNGVGHWSEQENGEDVDGFLHSSIARGPWYMRNQDCEGRGCGGRNNCVGRSVGCNVGLYIR